MVPGRQLFYSTRSGVPLVPDEEVKAAERPSRPFRDSGGGHTLFMRCPQAPGSLTIGVQSGAMLEPTWRNHQQLYTLRGINGAESYDDVPGFCKSAHHPAEIAAMAHVLTPGRYWGRGMEDDGEPFEGEDCPRLVAELEAQYARSRRASGAGTEPSAEGRWLWR